METQLSSFSNYLIKVGIRSREFTYTEEELFSCKKYFTRCYKKGFSSYIALAVLRDYLNGEYEI
jgi:hypothetical protein